MHTPLPWRVFLLDRIEDANRRTVATCACQSNTLTDDGINEDNAQFIVRACNAHNDLVAALSDLLTECDDMYATLRRNDYATCNFEDLRRVKNARAAIAKANGE